MAYSISILNFYCILSLPKPSSPRTSSTPHCLHLSTVFSILLSQLSYITRSLSLRISGTYYWYSKPIQRQQSFSKATWPTKSFWTVPRSTTNTPAQCLISRGRQRDLWSYMTPLARALDTKRYSKVARPTSSMVVLLRASLLHQRYRALRRARMVVSKKHDVIVQVSSALSACLPFQNCKALIAMLSTDLSTNGSL